MRKLCTTILLLCALITNLLAQQAHIPGEVMVMLNPGEDAKLFVKGLNDQHPGANFTISQDVASEWNIWLLGFNNQFITDESALQMVVRHPKVTLAQYNTEVQLRATPNDPSFATQQWALNNTGQAGGTAGADVDAVAAWDITTGGTTTAGDQIVVAVIDGGFQLNHPDLTANYWVNAGETAGNGIDDDGNGYIDDVNGWNAYGNNGTLPSDAHGTHVSGIIGARGNNGVGVSGVNWSVKVMRVAGSSGNQATVVSAYAYVAKQRKLYNQTNGAQGAYVVSTNASFGVDFGQAGSYPIWCAFYDTLGTLGILNAGAGPNANTNIDTQGDIPTTCPSQYMIAVTNTTRNDTRNNSSGYGPINMDIGAPGTDIYNTVTGSTYQSLTGTSMATPHVAGAIGLYYSAACADFITLSKTNPGAAALLMRGFLLTGVDSIPSMASTTSSKGRLNLLKGIQRLQANCNVAPPTPPTASFGVSDAGICVGQQVTFTDQSTNSPTSWSWTFPGGSPASSTAQNPTVTYNTAGSFNVTLTVANAGGSDSETQSSFVTVFGLPAAPTVTNNSGTFQSSYATGNQWYNAGGPIAGATGQTYTPGVNGSYYVIHTDANGCVSTASSPTWLTASVDEWLFDDLKIFPNPIGNQFTVSWSSTEVAVTGIRIYDATGRMIYSSKPTGTTITIHTHHLPAGSYILELATPKGNVRKPLVK